jgi:hypothetical protein
VNNMAEEQGTSYVLTVAAGKRLIAKGVAAMPSVRAAMENGMVAVGKGTTNAYVLEELLGHPLDKGAYCLGRTLPPGFDRAAEVFGAPMDEVVFRNGQAVDGLTIKQAAPDMNPGDVVMKGANALDYVNCCAGLLVGDRTGGTWGALAGPVHGRGLHAIIPIGLEKQVAEPLREIAGDLALMPEVLRPQVPGLQIIEGEIITELEALAILTGVTPYQIGAGGVCGAEGAVRIAVIGTAEQITATDELIEQIKDEPPFAG